MSFATFEDSQNGSPPKSTPTSDLAQILKDTSSQMQTYSSLISTFANERKLVGTRRDGPSFRAKMDESQASIQNLGQAIQELMSNVNVVSNSQSSGSQKEISGDPNGRKNGGQEGSENGGKKMSENGGKKVSDIGGQKSSERGGKNGGKSEGDNGGKVSGSGFAGERINGQLLMKDRIVSEFITLQGTFQALVRDYHNKKRVNPLPEKTPLFDSRGDGSKGSMQATETQPLLGNKQSGSQGVEFNGQVQEQVQGQETVDESELQYHVLLSEERNRQIEQVQEGIREVNSIFKDLGELVSSQGSQLDTVEENILQMSGNAYSADQELTKANEYQKRKNKWSCILLCALCVFVLVVVLAVVS